MGYSKGHYGKYTGNARCCMDHAHTAVTSHNYKDAVRDDAAHIDYLKRDVLYDSKHGHSDEKMTADEKHISKLAGDMKYDKKHHGSPAKHKRTGAMAKHKHIRPGETKTEFRNRLSGPGKDGGKYSEKLRKEYIKNKTK